MTLRLHPVLANLALLGASVVVALGATELVLRLVPGLLSEEARREVGRISGFSGRCATPASFPTS